MARVGLALAVSLLAGLACGCSGGGSSVAPTAPFSKPSPSSTWPAYPSFSAKSCWTQPQGNGVMRAAPSTLPKHSPVTLPHEIVRRLLGRLGDRRYIRDIGLGRPPATTVRRLHGYGTPFPADGLWAYIDAPSTHAQAGGRPTAEQLGRRMVGEWEANLVAGALRDDFCTAGGVPLLGWSIGGHVAAVSNKVFALEQNFPNPSPQSFRQAVATAGRRYSFGVVSLRLLRPRQLAPLLVLATNRERKSFVRDIPAIMARLDPFTTGGRDTARAFEGFLLEVRDTNGTFVRVENVNRGEAEGGQWSWDPCVYPFGHSQPLASKCP
jgi:hypothetical protein